MASAQNQPARSWCPLKTTPTGQFKEKRAITVDEHQAIVSREKNPERKRFYELCWHLGGSQGDIASLKGEDVDWENQTISFTRKKTGVPVILHLGEDALNVLKDLPSEGPLFSYLSRVRAGDRATEFKQRCVGLGIRGVSLHSYRYAWAQRAKTCGYPERFAQEALGHNSVAVHRAYLKDKNVQFAACDCDNENSTLKRFHGDDVQFLDLSHPRGLDAMIHALDKTDLVVVDCRAASTEVFFNYFDEIDLPLTLKNLSTALTLIMPINQEADSIDQLNRITDKLKNVCSYVVLRNTVHSDTFPLFENTVIRKRLLKELGAKEITMSKLQPWLVEELSHHNLTITAAVADGHMHLLDRQRLQTWQRKFYAQIEFVADLLLPAKP